MKGGSRVLLDMDMYIGSQQLMKKFDECLLKHGYTIEELVDKASDCLLKHIDGKSLSIVCGPGNNGADGLSLAIKLYQQGQHVKVFIFEDHEHLSQANAYYLQKCYDLSIEVYHFQAENLDQTLEHMKTSDTIVDAMFGFGLNSSPRGLYQGVIEGINQFYDKEVIAVDIPTGLDCNSGKPYQSVVSATKTITLSALKNGFLNPDSQYFTGEVIVEKLDLEDVSEEAGLYQLADEEYVSFILKDRIFDGYKGTYGHTCLITGSPEYKGAALLSAKSCVYSGSGITTVMSVPEVIQSLTHFCPEATAVIRAPILLKEDLAKYDALLIGCGLGQSLESYRYVIDVLEKTSQPLVIDADALTILSAHIDLLKTQKRDIILTPHLGEFRRLCDFKDDDDMLVVARDFALKYHVVLVLKGPYTIVTNGYESYRIFSGNKAMATGGMGDVLAGMITSFVGQGYSALQAAMLGVFIHGYAGDHLAETAYTVIPSKLIDYIPTAMHEIIKSNQQRLLKRN